MSTIKPTGGKLYGGSEHAYTPHTQRLPYVPPKGAQKKARPKDYLDFCAYSATRCELSYGAYIGATTEKTRRTAWKRYQAKH